MTRRLFPLMAVSLCLAASTAFGQQTDTTPDDSLDVEPFQTTQAPAPARTATGYSVNYNVLGPDGLTEKSWTSADSSHSVAISGEAEAGTGELDLAQALQIVETFRQRHDSVSTYFFGFKKRHHLTENCTTIVSTRAFPEPVRKYTENFPRQLISVTLQPPTDWESARTETMTREGQRIVLRQDEPCAPCQPDWGRVLGVQHVTRIP